MANLDLVALFLSSFLLAITIPILIIKEIPGAGDILLIILCYLLGFTICILFFIREPGVNLVAAFGVIGFAGNKLIVSAGLHPRWLVMTIVGVISVAVGILVGLYSKKYHNELLERKVLHKKKIRRYLGNPDKYAIYMAFESCIISSGILFLILSLFELMMGHIPVLKPHPDSSSLFAISLPIRIGISLVGIGWFFALRIRETRIIEKLKEQADNTENVLVKRILYSQWAYLSLANLDLRLRPRIRRLERMVHNNPEKEDLLKKLQAEYNASKEEYEKHIIDVDGEMSNKKRDAFSTMCEAYEEVMKCKRIWMILAKYRNNQYKSFAENMVEREIVMFETGCFGYLYSEFAIPALPAMDGETIYIYPEFIIKAKSNLEFEAYSHDSNEVYIAFGTQKHVEDHKGPSDADFLGYTYKYVNADGSRDHRFTLENNPIRYVYNYGDFVISPFEGKYEISNQEVAYLFCQAFAAL